MRGLVLLTPSEGKRLIAKAVVHLDVVKNALKNGIVIIGTGTTNAFIAEEILSKPIDPTDVTWGVVVSQGLSIAQGKHLYFIFVKGELQPELNVTDIYNKMDEDDVYIKGGNALDPHGEVGIIVGDPNLGIRGVGGLLTRAITRGVTIVVPIGLEKLIPTPLIEASAECGRTRLHYPPRNPIGLFVVHGNKVVVTEIEAIQLLSGATAIPVSAGGVNEAEGAVLYVIKGDDEQVRTIFDIIKSIKGEPPIKVKLRE